MLPAEPEPEVAASEAMTSEARSHPGSGFFAIRCRSQIHRWVARPWVGALCVGLGLLSLVAFGIVGIGRPVPINADMQFLYGAGRMWAEGISPYNLAAFDRSTDAMVGLNHQHVRLGFAYPPHIAPLCLLLGALPLRVAGAAMVGLNVAAAVAFALYAFRLSAAYTSDSVLRASLRWAVPTLAFGAPFSAHIVYGGQTTLLAGAALVAAWYYLEVRYRPVLAGVLLAVATIKPQVAALPVAYALIKDRRGRSIAGFAAAVLALVAIPVSVSGPFNLVHEWLQALRDYQSGPIQSVGFQAVFGIQSLLVAAGVAAPKLSWIALVVAGFAWWYRDQLAADEALGLLVATSLLFIYSHDYDLAALLPFFAFAWRISSTSTARAGVGVGFYALLFGPQRFVRSSHIAFVIHWREVVLLVAVASVLVDAFLRANRAEHSKSRQVGRYEESA